MTASARTVVLDSIRAGLGRAASARSMPAETWHSEAWTRPRCDEDPVSRFVTKAEANLCTVEVVASLANVVAAVQRRCAAHDFNVDDSEDGISVAPSLRGLPWPNSWRINFGPGRFKEAVAVTDAQFGIAETGSLVVCSHADRPAGLNFLPELHVCVLRTDDIGRHLEDAWPRLRALDAWPRAVNLISAASRTADVSQVVVRPAHGPKALHIVLVGST